MQVKDTETTDDSATSTPGLETELPSASSLGSRISLRVKTRWRSTPLAARLVAVTTILIVFELVVTATATIGVLQTFLVRQVDSDLYASSQEIALSSANAFANSTQTGVPSNYYVRFETVEGEGTEEIRPATVVRSGRPIIPKSIGLGETPIKTITRPVTVTSDQMGKMWRAIAIPLEVNGQLYAVVTLALPLTGMTQTLSSIAQFLFLSTIGVTFFGAFLAWLLVRRSLRPLQKIEIVAQRIAAGDLSRRVKGEAPGTEVGSLAISINKMLGHIESSFQARERSETKMRQFVSDASHELRTPLAAMRGYGELYRMGGLPPERVGEVMERIESEARRMGNLVEDLLQLARLDEVKRIKCRDFDVVKIIYGVASDMSVLAPDRKITICGLNDAPAPGSLMVRADRDKVSQIVTNLMGNILRYTPKGSPVEIAVGTRDENALIEVRDHGPGVPAKAIPRLFERFYRIDKHRARASGGSGLGLAIVHAIVLSHQGKISASQTDGGGLTIHIELPVGGPIYDSENSPRNGS